VTGAFGQIGSELIYKLVEQHGEARVVALSHHTLDPLWSGIVEQGDITDVSLLTALIEKHQVNVI